MSDKIKITLSDARPMLVTKALWPIVAKVDEDEDRNRQELPRRYFIRVRMHAVRTTNEALEIEYYGADKDGALPLAPHPDGRVVVYGWRESSFQGEAGAEAGYVCTLDDAVATVRRVGEEIEADESVIMECIGDLPPVEETESGELIASLSTEQLRSELARRQS